MSQLGYFAYSRPQTKQYLSLRGGLNKVTVDLVGEGRKEDIERDGEGASV